MAEQTCVACGYVFAFDPAFYSDRGLRPPLRCRACRDVRRDRCARRSGVLVSAGDRFAVVLADGGGDYVTDPLPRSIRVGARVTFDAGPEDERTESRRPHAYHVEPA
jgi:hypothetical protein